MKKSTALMLVLAAAFAMGTFVLVQPEPADAMPPGGCGMLCQRVYDRCIADGWPHSECAPKEDLCFNACIASGGNPCPR